MKRINGKVINLKYRLDPDRKQTRFLNGQLEANRIFYNYCIDVGYKELEKNKELPKEERKNLSIKVKRGDVYKNNPWLKDYISSTFDFEIINATNAFYSWFNFQKRLREYNRKNGITDPIDPNLGKPVFKKRFKKYGFKLKSRYTKLIDENHIKIPLMGKPLKFILHESFPNNLIRIISVTIKKSKSGEFYIVFTAEVEDFPTLSDVDYSSDKVIALDLGIRKHIVYKELDGTVGEVPNPKNYKKFMDRKIRLNRWLSKCTIGSNRWLKVKKKLAVVEEKIARARKYHLDCVSSDIIRKYDTIIVERLDVSSIVQSTNEKFKNVSRDARHNINRDTYDVGWYMFTQMLKYKSEWNGRNFFEIDTHNRTVQTCSVCGFINKDLKDNIEIREWDCPECKTHHDRCINAASNILQLYQEGKVIDYLKKE